MVEVGLPTPERFLIAVAAASTLIKPQPNFTSGPALPKSSAVLIISALSVEATMKLPFKLLKYCCRSKPAAAAAGVA